MPIVLKKSEFPIQYNPESWQISANLENEQKKKLGSRLPSLSFPWAWVHITWSCSWSQELQDMVLFPNYTPLILMWANQVSGQGMRPQKMESVLIVYRLVQCTSLTTAFSVGSWTTWQQHVFSTSHSLDPLFPRMPPKFCFKALGTSQLHSCDHLFFQVLWVKLRDPIGCLTEEIGSNGDTTEQSRNSGQRCSSRGKVMRSTWSRGVVCVWGASSWTYKLGRWTWFARTQVVRKWST